MKPQIFILFVSVSLLCMCSMSRDSSVNRYNANGKPNGKWVYLMNDKTQSYGRYKDGVPVGRWIIFNPDGSKCVKKRYFQNKIREVWYHKNGRVEAKGWSKLILDDPLEINYFWDGKWKFFDKKGKLKKISIYVKGEENEIIMLKTTQANE